MTLQSAASDLALMEAAARAAGAVTRAAFGKRFETWSKGAAGPVTEIDLAADALIKDHLLGARPDYGWLSEETADSEARLERSHVFIVDPIDGTQAFIQSIPQYAISIGLAIDGRAALGVIYNPQTDQLFVGGVGAPARCNGAPIAASARVEIEGARIVGKEALFSSRRWAREWPKMDFVFRHSIALRLALVAAGEADAAMLFGFKHEWDIAAGVAIIEAAGGHAGETDGGALRFNRADPRVVGVTAAGARLHALLTERLKDLPHPSAWGELGGRMPAKAGTDA